MHGPRDLTQTLCVATLALVAAISMFGGRSLCASDQLATEKLPIAWQDDAQLTDVCFINATTGWAVGSQGVILRTTDGGKHWMHHGQASVDPAANVSLSQKLQDMRRGAKTRWTGVAAEHGQPDRLVRCRLESVHFINQKEGWVAGGYWVPWLNRSRGVVLKTVDGGATWHRIPQLTIPAVSKIHFQDRRTGWAIGETNELHPSGIYYTSNGGKNWTSTSDAATQPWRRGQATVQGHVLVSDVGRLLLSVGDQQRPPALFGCTRDDRVVDVTMVDDQIGYAVGPQGLLLKTDNGGAAWRRLRLKSLDDETSLKTDSLSFSRVTVAKGFAWLSVQNRQSLIRVNLSDRTVTSITLPTNATVHQVVFADPTHAFAVGEFGTILASSDGGQTWKRQRGTHDRVGLLLVARTAQQVPLGMLAIHAGEESRICGTVLLSDSANQDAHTSTAAARHAFERVGSTVNLGADVLATGGSSVETLAEVIQRLRPSAVVCCEEPLAGNQLATITDAAVKRAAADADSQPAWQVERMITASVAGSVQIDHRRMLPSLGKTVGDAIAISRAILGQSLRGSRPSSWAIRDLATPRRIVGSDLMSGLGQNGNAIPLREQRTALGNLNAMKQSLALQKKRNDYAQLDVKSDQDRIAWQQQVLATALPMDSDEAGLWLADLAEQTLLTGQLIKTANTLRLLATRWPNHGLAPAINAWLSAYGSSSEAAATQLARAGDERPETDQTDRLRQAAVHLGQIGRGDPALALSPAVRWLEFRLLAQSSDRAAVESRLKKLAGGRSGEALLFAAAARAELDGLNGLEKSADVRSSNAMRCVYARERPYLDGALNDAVWQAARKGGAVENYQLASATQPDEVYFARDDKFFYAAYKCQKIAGKTYRSPTAPRPRDPDLSRRDRVRLQIDTDRDFCSTLTLEVDHRGWAADSALGNSHWNPQWFVAQASDDQTWTIEFAIPLDEFVAIKPTDFDRWAIRLDRLATGRQSLWHERTNSQIDAQSGLQAAMLPDPRGFQILAIEGDSAGSNQRQLTARRTDSHYDRQVKPAQFQLELEPLPKLQQAPEIPQLGNLP